MKVKDHGQVFTPEFIVDKMISMMENDGEIMEPSCGDGAFTSKLPSTRTVSIEMDKDVAHENAIIMDFMEFEPRRKLDTIIGNPPYVKSKLIGKRTKELIKDRGLVSPASTNLYILFMERCFNLLNEGGELIFIVPYDFTKATNAKNLNNLMMKEGSFTHYYEYLGDENPFVGATVDPVIFRYVKGLKQKKAETNKGKKFVSCIDGQLFFTSKIHKENMSNLAKVSVGSVPGHKSFKNARGDIKMVSDKTLDTGELVSYMSAKPRKCLEDVKEYRLSMDNDTWNEGNWFKWIRGYKEVKAKCVYVSNRTRRDNPFFVCEEADAHDGTLLAIYPKNQDIDIYKFRDYLNNIDWSEFGFKVGGRYLFSQRALENTMLPDYAN